MKLDINKEEVLKQLIGDGLYDFYSSIKAKESYEERKKKYEEQGLDKKARLRYTDEQLTAQISMAIWMKSQEYCPIDTGKLRNTSKLSRYKNGWQISYPMSYASYVHEIPYYSHKYPTRYKFLEEAAIEVATQYLQDYSYPVELKINYYPLELYIDCYTNIGVELKNVKAKEKLINIHKKELIDKVLKAYTEQTALDTLGLGFDTKATEYLNNYVDWWSTWHKTYKHKDLSYEELVYEWLLRNRHMEQIPHGDNAKAERIISHNYNKMEGV